jgi:hypothetical protein
MKNIKFFAQFYSTGLYTEEELFIHKSETSIDDHTWVEMAAWGYDYERLIPFYFEHFTSKDFYNVVFQLDMAGIELLRKIQEQWRFDQISGEPINIRYYSTAIWQFIEPLTEENYKKKLQKFIEEHDSEFKK